MNFNVLKIAVANQFNRMQKHPMFRVEVDKDLLWDTYLKSFPPTTDPIYRERSEHDCTCCKQFVRSVGDAVAIIDGKVESIWDISIKAEPAYETVAKALSTLVKSLPVVNLFLHYERTAGTDKNFEQLTTGAKTWEHFFVNIQPQFVAKNADIATKLGERRAVRDVFHRGLTEITDEAVEIVTDLIAQNSLYRGTEHKFAVDEFSKLKKKFNKLSPSEQVLFTWTNISSAHESVTKIRGTAIGTLLTDLSEGKDIESSVASFENKKSGTNYKRPTALITKGMIENAKKKLDELGLTSALERRYATINDITINNIMFADRKARSVINGDVFDELVAATGKKVKVLDTIEEVSIERFISEILPRAESIEVMLENHHASNMVSLIAPVDPTAGRLFKWDNNFSWSYDGEVADSIKERVKKAGGNVVGDLCCRLAWFNFDDLDFHMIEPDGKYEIYFGNRTSPSPSGGLLDVDMNAGAGTTRAAVENIFYASKSKMKEGIYSLEVKNFNKRESIDVGFEVEVDFLGTTHNFVYNKAVRDSETIIVAKIKYSHKNGIEIVSSIPSSQSVKSVWGLPTQAFHKVEVMMMSPNFWDEKSSGNKHYFFMLENCLNEGTSRGFFNEFLKEDLNAHRKVFEMVGSKMKVPASDKQLSGIGVSSTQKNTLICRVKGSFARTIRIIF
jgi:hypothetical protein